MFWSFFSRGVECIWFVHAKNRCVVTLHGGLWSFRFCTNFGASSKLDRWRMRLEVEALVVDFYMIEEET